MNFFRTPGAASLNSVERELQSNVHNQEEPQTHTTPNTTRLPLSPTEPLTSSDSLLHFYQRGHPSYSTTTRRFFGYIFLLFFLTSMITSIILGVLYIRKDRMLHQLSQQQQQQQQKVTPQRPFLTLLQSNDLYEIQSMGGKGGFSRLSALYKALPGLHKIHVFAGDLISPSPMSLIKINGKPLRGEHMIDIGNDVFDIAALGNHEFDYDAETTMKRLSESTFPWIRTNVLPENGIFAELDKMGKTKAYEIRTYSIPREILGEEVKLLRVAFIGLSPVYQPVKFVKIQSIAETLAALPSLLAKIRTQHAPHLVVAITHWNLKDDIQLAAADLGIDLILGGHEHENILTFRPPRNTPITKVDSDAESVYIHTVHLYQSDVTNEAILSEFPSNTPSIVRRADLVLAVTRRLQEVTEDLPTDPTVDLKVEKWWQIGRQGFLDAGYDVDEEIYTLDSQWDLRRDWISTYMATKEGTLFSECLMWCGQTYMAHAANKPRMSLLSSGQIRIDAVVFPRTLTTYDVFRMVPYLTNLITASIRGGSLLNAIRTSLSENVGEGGFLLWSSNFTCDTGNANTDLQCVLDGQPIQEDEMYEIYTNNFLLSGNERNMEGLRADGNNILVTGTAGADGPGVPLQRCIVDYLKRSNLENQKKTKKRTEQRKELNGRHHG